MLKRAIVSSGQCISASQPKQRALSSLSRNKFVPTVGLFHSSALVKAKAKQSKAGEVHHHEEVEGYHMTEEHAHEEMLASHQTTGAHNAVEKNEGFFFWNISARAFDTAITKILLDDINANDIEIKPDGIMYLPEIKYRRILNAAFGPGGWALMPRGTYRKENQFISQEYALFCLGQFVSQAWGEQAYAEHDGGGKRSLATALEGAKSNALMRCCKDIGVASELWDPEYIVQWKEKYAVAVWAEDVKSKQKKKLWRRKDRPAFEYPYKESGYVDPREAAATKAEATHKQSQVPEVGGTDQDFDEVVVGSEVEQGIEEYETAQPAEVEEEEPASDMVDDFAQKSKSKAPAKKPVPPSGKKVESVSKKFEEPKRGQAPKVVPKSAKPVSAPAASGESQSIPFKDEGEDREFMFDTSGDDPIPKEAMQKVSAKKFNPNAAVQFGKHKGQTWRQLLSTKSGIGYLKFLLGTDNLAPNLKAMITQALEYHAENPQQ